jgi:hypothetical protein
LCPRRRDRQSSDDPTRDNKSKNHCAYPLNRSVWADREHRRCAGSVRKLWGAIILARTFTPDTSDEDLISCNRPFTKDADIERVAIASFSCGGKPANTLVAIRSPVRTRTS